MKYLIFIIVIASVLAFLASHASNINKNPYIIDGLTHKHRDGFCFDKWEMEYVRKDKWLYEEERNALLDQKKCKEFIYQ